MNNGNTSKLDTFLDFVEIRTKVATVFPFLLALLYVIYHTGSFNLVASSIYIIAAVLVDCGITAINNYKDSRQEEESTPHFSDGVSKAIIFGLFGIAAILGLVMIFTLPPAYNVLPILLAAMACFAIGIAYTFGPMPISKSVFGELFAGLTCGFLIMFIVASINDPYLSLIDMNLFLPATPQESFYLYMSMDINHFIGFFLVTLSPVALIANILLANNICDREKDRKYRYTLTHHIGLKNALRTFAALHYVAYLSIIICVIIGELPITSILVLLTIVPVQKNINLFKEKQIKRETFGLSVKNYLMIIQATIATVVLGILINWIF